MLKTIVIAVGLTMATTSYGLSKEYEEYAKIRDQISHDYFKAVRTATPEERKRLRSDFCVDKVANLLVRNRRVQTKRGATEEKIKREGRKVFMDLHINFEDYEEAKLASIRGRYFEHLEWTRKRKLCHINAYEELTGTTL